MDKKFRLDPEPGASFNCFAGAALGATYQHEWPRADPTWYRDNRFEQSSIDVTSLEPADTSDKAVLPANIVTSRQQPPRGGYGKIVSFVDYWTLGFPETP